MSALGVCTLGDVEREGVATSEVACDSFIRNRLMVRLDNDVEAAVASLSREAAQALRDRLDKWLERGR